LEVGVARPGVAIDAAVLAAAVGIDGLREADVGRVVVRNDRARALDGDARLELARVGFLGRPAVVERFARRRLEAAGNERAGAAQVEGFALRVTGHGARALHWRHPRILGQYCINEQYPAQRRPPGRLPGDADEQQLLAD